MPCWRGQTPARTCWFTSRRPNSAGPGSCGQRYDDKPDISFVDFTSMVLMQDLGIVDVFTGDAHFLGEPRLSLATLSLLQVGARNRGLCSWRFRQSVLQSLLVSDQGPRTG